ncbi:META domain-containing protein [Gordonia sp. HY002]|uniref:META domain-containing protein n=1 Tax=Gordonia zhenghanii TaxID=2911516 RepID=UPI001EEFC431|nr:META domain-containing protein [Gordonia zhenghanii]MCF8571791.1 META domain-containing protein [Gordonia zhenghanii]MCF8604803.1 META domain-containing protein [Gordonia zhenghanii]
MDRRRRGSTRAIAFVRAAATGAALVAALAACDSGSGGAEDSAPDPARLVGKTYVSDNATDTKVPGGGPFVLSFGTENRISANAGCNGHGGTVEFDGDTLTTGPLMGTMMACPPPRDTADKWVSDLFDSPLTWSLEGRTLTLSRGDLEVRLDQRVDRAVAGTNWRVKSLIAANGVTTSRVLDEIAPTVTIGAEGTLRGFTGCNRMTGEATVTGTRPTQKVMFGPIATTRKACPGEAGDIERSVLAVLSGEATATVDGDRMRLTNVADPSIGLELTVSRESGGK